MEQACSTFQQSHWTDRTFGPHQVPQSFCLHCWGWWPAAVFEVLLLQLHLHIVRDLPWGLPPRNLSLRINAHSRPKVPNGVFIASRSSSTTTVGLRTICSIFPYIILFRISHYSHYCAPVNFYYACNYSHFPHNHAPEIFHTCKSSHSRMKQIQNFFTNTKLEC